ncbi:hypothetical protein F6455_12990 [Proteobacteria bacterium 005FR1]|nr:hypothetical protein [Proteobacteria bacterium 005FR1]
MRLVPILRKSYKSIVALLLLFVFGLQVQASFACKIADHSGPVEQCCCEATGDKQPEMDMGDSSGCCELSQNFVVKGSDPAQEHEPALPDRSSDLDLPPVLFALVAIWIDQQLPPAKPGYGLTAVPPHTLGTATYLMTQRLRI